MWWLPLASIASSPAALLKNQKGAVGTAATCDDARSSSGTLLQKTSGKTTNRFEVIGQTEAYHPLRPGADAYGPSAISIIESTSLFDGTTNSVETFRAPGGAPASWEEVREAELSHASAATYAGIAADEYVVRLDNLGDTWAGAEGEGGMVVELMTRNNAGDGDLWTSIDGNLLYQADGFEDIAVGDSTQSARRVRVLSVENIDPEGQSVFADCMREDVNSLSTTNPGQDDFTVTSVALDPSCDTAFVHRELGTEWWVNNVMVQSTKTTYQVAVNDFGYEWFNAEGDNCTRQTSATRDDSDAALYVEYTVTELVTTMNTSEWSIAAAE
ncbi:MAG: hypothetical protein GY822_16910 [Deltaproteobacteria bacterium]|nr:hypothetical protein [Deltaproteobacteria bacterium]